MKIPVRNQIGTGMDGKYVKPSPVKESYDTKTRRKWKDLLEYQQSRNRIVQMAAKIAIEPVFQLTLEIVPYGFRPKRSARQALEVGSKACNNKGYYVVDADIEKILVA